MYHNWRGLNRLNETIDQSTNASTKCNHFRHKLIFNFFSRPFPFALSDPPEIVKRPANQAVRVGGVASFFCSARGDPVPSIVWRKNGKKVPGTQSRYSVTQIDGLSILRIEPVRAGRDDAPYECVAENGVGDAVSAEATLTVYEGTSQPPKTKRKSNSLWFVNAFYVKLNPHKTMWKCVIIIVLCKKQNMLQTILGVQCGVSISTCCACKMFKTYMPFSTFFISVDMIKCSGKGGRG